MTLAFHRTFAVTLKHGTPGHKRTYGAIEIANQGVATDITKRMSEDTEGGDNWTKHLADAIETRNNTPTPGLGFTPYELQMRRPNSGCVALSEGGGFWGGGGRGGEGEEESGGSELQ
jgi:hypothetical protein